MWCCVVSFTPMYSFGDHHVAKLKHTMDYYALGYTCTSAHAHLHVDIHRL